MKAAVITFPGSNRDGDVAKALKQAGAEVNHVWHGDTELPDGTDLVVLPGGFSYGDYLRTGAIAGRAHIMDATRAHAARGGYVLGICNGFQIACEAGLLPGILVRNAHLKFVCKRQHLRSSATTRPIPAPMPRARRSMSASPMAKATTSPMPRRSRASKARASSPSAMRMSRAT